ncbi:MAG TPA: xanthine dehydrogenase family protein subunit M [Geminicoccaceae bacterium]|nr:xanthine dehydrogenase family protein subunit M [Geminicoccaceae bacterium]
MQPFEYVLASSPEAALASAAGVDGTAFIAGGTDLMQLMKEGAAAPRRLIDVNRLPWTEIALGPQGLRLGALARMSDVADDPCVRERFPMIAQALLASASAQVRNMATIGGNLLQRTRCTYFRDPAMPCNKRAPGTGCSAIEGDNRLHAIFGGSAHCVATHPSDLAVALVALEAVVVVRGPAGERRIGLCEFYRLPGDTPERETVLEPGELIVAVEVPACAPARRSHYLKIRDRASFEFALVSVAVGLDIGDGVIHDARLAAGGVGTKPWRLRTAEEALNGGPATPETYRAAAERAIEGASPLAMNGFKVELLRRAVCRALATAGDLT